MQLKNADVNTLLLYARRATKHVLHCGKESPNYAKSAWLVARFNSRNRMHNTCLTYYKYILTGKYILYVLPHIDILYS